MADENISGLVTASIRRLGHDVTSVAERQTGLPDMLVLKTAEEDSQFLVTEDTDFGELVIRRGQPVCGVILLELDRLSNEAEAQRVETVVRDYADRLNGHLVVIEPHRVRLRPLPSTRVA